MTKQILFFSCLILMLTSCASTNISRNTLVDFYSGTTDFSDFAYECFLQDSEEPQLFNTTNLLSDIISLEKDQYILVGNSSWNGPDTNMDNIIKVVSSFCKEKKFTCALISKKYTETRSGITSSTHYSYENDYNYTTNGGFFTTKRVPHTRYESYEVDRYDYTIAYFINAPDNYLSRLVTGFAVRELTDEERIKFGQNNGVVVDVVINNTNAFNANIIENDVITMINEYQIKNYNDYKQAISKISIGDDIKIQLVRNNSKHTIRYTT